MPNGGPHFCRNCRHFVAARNLCSLRSAKIKIPYQTTCRDFDQPTEVAHGPLYSMVSEAKDHKGWHLEIPYYDGCRPETVALSETGDTKVVFTDASGTTHGFPSADAYLRFFVKTGREP